MPVEALGLTPIVRQEKEGDQQYSYTGGSETDNSIEEIKNYNADWSLFHQFLMGVAGVGIGFDVGGVAVMAVSSVTVLTYLWVISVRNLFRMYFPS